MEVGVGIENIFKVLRIDNIWRISYLDHPGISKVAMLGTVSLSFWFWQIGRIKHLCSVISENHFPDKTWTIHFIILVIATLCYYALKTWSNVTSRDCCRQRIHTGSSGWNCGFAGAKRCRKTTSFYMIVGLIKPNEGKIYLDDQEITNLPDVQAITCQLGIGYLAQEASVFESWA